MLIAEPPPSADDRQWYGYTPSLGVGITGLVLFTLSTIGHSYQTWNSRMWWLIVLVLGGITEIIGYSARIYSNHDDKNLDSFLAQTVTLIIAPSFFSAALYVVFGEIIKKIGVQYSMLKPIWYTIIFVIADIISLVVQAIGGGSASEATKKNEDNTSGTHVMVGGICWQMFSMAVFVILVIIYMYRITTAKLHVTPRMQQFLFGMGIVTLMIFIRCIYRTVELMDGWEGYIITHEVFFACLDGLPMVIALVAFNVWHPGFYLNAKDIVSEEAGSVDGAAVITSTEIVEVKGAKVADSV